MNWIIKNRNTHEECENTFKPCKPCSHLIYLYKKDPLVLDIEFSIRIGKADNKSPIIIAMFMSMPQTTNFC